MDTDGKPLRGQRGDRLLESVELLTDGSPAVDDEEHLAARVDAYRIDTAAAQSLLASVHQCP